jgi:hypothetical protein
MQPQNKQAPPTHLDSAAVAVCMGLIPFGSPPRITLDKKSRQSFVTLNIAGGDEVLVAMRVSSAEERPKTFSTFLADAGDPIINLIWRVARLAVEFGYFLDSEQKLVWIQGRCFVPHCFHRSW